MKFQPMKVTDKTGHEVILRNAEINDAQSLIDYLKITMSETPFLLREPDEVTLTLEQEQRFIQSKVDSDGDLMLVAVIDGKHVGSGALMSVGEYKRYRHRCGIAIALYQAYCSRGIGKIMLETILRIAKESGYEQAELEVIVDNERAITLYESLGFEKYGRFPNHMKYQNGTYADAYWMMKRL